VALERLEEDANGDLLYTFPSLLNLKALPRRRARYAASEYTWRNKRPLKRLGLLYAMTNSMTSESEKTVAEIAAQ